MVARVSLALLTLTLACGSIWQRRSAVTPMSVSEAYACADSVSKSLGYRPYQAKVGEGLLRTRKHVEQGTGEIFDHQPYDQLEVNAVSAKGGRGSTLTIEAQSWVEQVSRQGRTQVEQPSRPAVVADASTIATVCGGSAPAPDRVPDAH